MSLLITIFFLVFVAQLVTWIGKTVLLDIVGAIIVLSAIATEDVWQITRSPSAPSLRHPILVTCPRLAGSS